MTDPIEDQETGINRRTVLKGAATVSGAGLIGFSATGTAAADEHCGPGCDPQCEAEVPLCAAQDIEVGTVYVRRVPDEDQIEVEYVLDGETENDWYLRETHLYVGKTDPTELSSAPGQFPFTEEEYGDGVTSYTYTIGFDEICEYETGGGSGKGNGGGGKWEEVDGSCGVEEGDCVWIAAHAVVDEVLIEAPYFAADAEYEADQGVKKNGEDIDDDRSDPEDALVKAYPDGNFFSLGFMPDGDGGFEEEGGWIEITFDCPVVNGDGDDLRLWEVTFADYPEEKADVYAWYDGDWRFLSTADNSGQGDEDSPEAHTLSTFDLGNPADEDYDEIESTGKIKIVDKTDPTLHNGNAEGFDLDGIEVLQDCTRDETAWGDGCEGCEITDGGNWATYFQYGIGVDCGEETLPECPMYGTSRVGSEDDEVEIWSIRYDADDDEIVEEVVGDIPDNSDDENYPNGLGFDPDTEVWYFTEEGGILKTMNEDGCLGVETYNGGNSISGGDDVAGATVYDGAYYFTPQDGDDLLKVELDSDGGVVEDDGSVTTENVRTLPVTGNTFGDIAADDDGVLYFSVNGAFFTVDLNDSANDEVIVESDDRDAYAILSQLAFDDTGALWAHHAGDGEWRTVDLSDGSLSDVVETTKTYTDLATCGTYELNDDCTE